MNEPQELPQEDAAQQDPVLPETGEPTPVESEIDRLVAQVQGPDDQVGMAALWRVAMHLQNWWFIAVGEEGLESPAAAEVDGQLVLLAFTDAHRARFFAVQQQMIEEGADLAAIALPPVQVVESAADYLSADIQGLMFDSNISGFYLPVDQMRTLWDTVMKEPDGDDAVTDSSATGDAARWADGASETPGENPGENPGGTGEHRTGYANS